VSLTFHVLWLLCGLCAATFASVAVVHTSAAARVWPWLALAIGFAGGVLTRSAGGSIDAAWVGGLSATVAALELVRPGHYLVTGAAAGALTSLWTGLMQAQGLPGVAAYAMAVTVACLCAFLSQRRPDFAPILVREEALLGLGVLALVVAMAPAISRGWQSALALNVTDGSAATPPLPVWMMSFVAGSVALGGAWSWWRRRRV